MSAGQPNNRQETNTPVDQPRTPMSTFRLMFVGRGALRLGETAMEAMGGIRRFLNTEITIPKPTEIFGAKPKLPDDVREREKQELEKLKQMVLHSREVICQAQTVFPLTLFPDDVVLDRTKVTIVKRNFFWSSNVISIRIEDILNVSSNVGPFFGSLILSIRIMNSVDHFQIDRFWRSDAIYLKKMIQGYMIARNNDVSLDTLKKQELIDTLLELGHDAESVPGR